MRRRVAVVAEEQQCAGVLAQPQSRVGLDGVDALAVQELQRRGDDAGGDHGGHRARGVGQGVAFLYRRAHQTYVRYAQSQFAKARARRERTGEPRWKHVVHLLRLMISGAALLETGTVQVDVGPHRDRLLTVRRGELSPDTARVEDWLVSVRRQQGRCAVSDELMAGQ